MLWQRMAPGAQGRQGWLPGPDRPWGVEGLRAGTIKEQEPEVPTLEGRRLTHRGEPRGTHGLESCPLPGTHSRPRSLELRNRTVSMGRTVSLNEWDGQPGPSRLLASLGSSPCRQQGPVLASKAAARPCPAAAAGGPAVAMAPVTAPWARLCPRPGSWLGQSK